MSDQNPDYAAIRRNIEKGIARQRWNYRIIFFVMHVIFYVVMMMVVWGTVMTYPQLRDLLFNGSSASLVVIAPSILWAVMILCHVAALFTETSAGEQNIRQRLLMQEVGEEILRKGLADDGMQEKPKRRAEALETEFTRLSDDGELIPADEDEGVEESDYNVRAKQTGHS